MKNGKEYKVIGLMSGTSLDGLDIAAVTFRDSGGNWAWELLQAETITYSDEWTRRLGECMSLSGEDLSRLHVDLGAYFGTKVTEFMDKNSFQPDLVASHGHTVFHQPGHRLTLQIGAGTEIYAASGVPVVCDFRTLDLALGGHGAPLVPVGDRYLFGEYDACLNLGGIANISYEQGGNRIAYDICPCNMILNRLAKREGRIYDEDGILAAGGEVLTERLDQLNALAYYSSPPPKSLGQEYIESDVLPVLEKGNARDLLRTSVEHTAQMISRAVRQINTTTPEVLITGGGAFNSFLIKRMQELLGDEARLVVPDPQIVSYKEALVFAFLGVLRIRGEINVWASVTGAVRDSSSGILFGEIDGNL